MRTRSDSIRHTKSDLDTNHAEAPRPIDARAHGRSTGGSGAGVRASDRPDCSETIIVVSNTASIAERKRVDRTGATYRVKAIEVGKGLRASSFGFGTMKRLLTVGIVTVAASLLLVSCSSSGATKSASGLLASPQPHTSGPAVCRSLASEVALRQLPAALTDLYSKSKVTEVHDAVKHAIVELNQLGNQGPKVLAESMAGTAGALRQLLDSSPSAASVNTLGGHLEDLATEVQQTCHFSAP
jgi:hypothetical protein